MCSGSGVMALAITPPGVFGYLRFLQAFKPRFKTALLLGPVRTAREYFSSLETASTNYYHIFIIAILLLLIC